MTSIQVFDNVIANPDEYLQAAQRTEFKTFDFGEDEKFHGIALAGDLMELPRWISSRFPMLAGTVTFFRKSPFGQIEPTFIHTDFGMGEWTGILYLNRAPAEGDGTVFWKHRETGKIASDEVFDGSGQFSDIAKWEQWQHVHAAFNRLLLFPARYFHSRALFANYGNDKDARLIQVVFGTGEAS